MYITINGTDYPCTCNPRRIWPIHFINAIPETVSGVISLHADDGFELRRDDCADYLRVIFNPEAKTLILTNEPEPEPEPIPEPVPTTPPTTIEDIEAALCEIDETNEIAHSAYETALCDIDEAINGGVI